MEFSVTKSSQSMVRPAKPTPSGTLPLSAIDKLPGLKSKVKTFHVFGPGHEPAKVIREAMSKALVHYYPIAGRMSETDTGDLHIACTGEGVLFVEATADCKLENIDYLSHPLVAASHNDLLPDPRPEMDPTNMLVLMQVTQFACGGFVIALEFCHCICDGLGAAQFLNAVAELARGLEAPTVEPVWQREIIPLPPTRVAYATQEEAEKSFRPPPAMPNYHLERAVVDVVPDDIHHFKTLFSKLTGQNCSVFEVLAASVWQRRTRAIGIEPGTEVRLVFFANARPLVRPALPEGFYGNCFFPVIVTISSGQLVRASIVEVVKLIKEAKGKLPARFAEWAAGEGEDPYVPVLAYTTLFVSEWSRLGFGQIDYGWGKPVQIVPITYSDIIPVCILGSPTAPKKGSRLITQCVEEAHLVAFHEQMKSGLHNEEGLWS